MPACKGPLPAAPCSLFTTPSTGSLDFLDLVEVEGVTFGQFIRALDTDAALVPGLYFLDVVLEAFERGDLAVVDFLAAAHDSDHGVAAILPLVQ